MQNDSEILFIDNIFEGIIIFSEIPNYLRMVCVSHVFVSMHSSL